MQMETGGSVVAVSPWYLKLASVYLKKKFHGRSVKIEDCIPPWPGT